MSWHYLSPVSKPTISEIISLIERHYPVELADPWDQVGMSVASEDRPIERVLLTVDLTDEVLQEAVSSNASLIVTHHPLQLSDLPDLITDDHIARLVFFAAKHQISIYSAHTNADNATDGVSDAILNALNVAATGSISDPGSLVGTGRVGELAEPKRLLELAKQVAEILPANHAGVKIAGDPERLVRHLAVCGGSGAGLLPQVALLPVDAYLTADLKHHAVLDHQGNSEIALINVSHWASEWLWLAVLAKKLNQEFPVLEVQVSQICTDPWTAEVHVRESL